MATPALTLAALATAAIPDLEISGVRPHTRGSRGDFDAAQLTCSDGRNLLVRFPVTASAETEQSTDLVALRAVTTGVRSRLPFQIPAAVGQTPFRDSRVVVYDFLPGDSSSADELTAGETVAESVGAAIAAVHSLPPGIVTDAGLPYDSATQCRLDTATLIREAADTGHVPRVLTGRWEKAIDNEELWQFQTTVINGALSAESFLVDQGVVSAVIGWSGLRVSDPALDVSWLMSARGASAEHALNSYTDSRSGGIDRMLTSRAVLYGELEVARWLLHGLKLHDDSIVADAITMMEGLVAGVHTEQARSLTPEAEAPLAVTEVEELLEHTPRSAGHTGGGALLTDGYEPGLGENPDSEREPERTSARPAATTDETSPLPVLDLSGFGTPERGEGIGRGEKTERAAGESTTADAHAERNSSSS